MLHVRSARRRWDVAARVELRALAARPNDRPRKTCCLLTVLPDRYRESHGCRALECKLAGGLHRHRELSLTSGGTAKSNHKF